ncbi:hypothetical protein ABFS82_08G164000 [Erythranthe guttata]|uniref:F-box protein At-B n=1 Tax=Erythranthe guttata TaxID=4155 RepID=UPI00064DE07C|nr:PREDICTED: F-box protein At-B [Erythranthe guttata]|eukprot:XP_012841854.1 PREDICTED: F-box protein At-B [Erythranthe guttata]
MKNCSKRPRAETAASPPETGGAPPLEGFPLPDTIILSEIFKRLELESLCTVACVCRSLRSIVSQSLSTLASLDISAFSPNGELVRRIVPRLRGVKSVTIDCLHLNDSSVISSILRPPLQELNLLNCASLSYQILASIGDKCPNLRILVVEFAGKNSPDFFRRNLIEMLKNLIYLEHLSIKIRGTEVDAYDLSSIDLFLPKALKSLKLQPLDEQDATHFIKKLRDEREIPMNLSNSSFGVFTLVRLSLVLDVITDRLMNSITSSLPLLVDLDLEDRPCFEPKLPLDLTNNGLQSLISCRHLTHLSIVRSRLNSPVSFKRVNDMGIFLLAESCIDLESIKLGGFSKVTDAGFSSLHHSSHKLKKLEIRNAPSLSDMAFHEITGVVELKLQSCPLVTSESISELASSSTLELLDTNGCRSIADHCIEYISCVSTLTSLNLGGADITDSGLDILSRADLPLTHLSLRGCTRVNDRGIICLFNGELKIKKTLLSLDIGYMPGISDRAIRAIVSSCDAISELCMRYCFYVSDNSLRMLAKSDCKLRKLDVYHCVGLSDGMVEVMEGGFFRGLRWFGAGGTLAEKGGFGRVCERRPWLTVCFEGCEIGCHDGWQFHKYNDGY